MKKFNYIAFITSFFTLLFFFNNCNQLKSLTSESQSQIIIQQDDQKQNQQQDQQSNDEKDDEVKTPSFKFPAFMPQAIDAKAHANNEAKKMLMPAFLNFLRDPDSNAKVWRLGGDQTEMLSQVNMPADSNWTPNHSQHYYSRNPVTNSDETYMLGSAGAYRKYAALWRMEDKKLVAWVPTAANEDFWSQRLIVWDRNQNNVYWFTESNQLKKVTIDFNNYTTTVEVWDTFSDFQYVAIGRGEGELSDDSYKVAITGHNDTETTILSYNILDKKIVSSLRNDGIDWASVDPTGTYVVYTILTDNEQSMESVLFENLNSTPVVLFEKSKHSTFVVDNQDEVWLAWGDWRGVFIANLKDGKTKKIWPNLVEDPAAENPPHQTASGHISRVSAEKGLLLVSRIGNGDIFFVNTDIPEKSVIVGNAHLGALPEKEFNTRSLALPYGITSEGEVTRYLRETRASSSQSGRYVFFTSDYRIWGDQFGDYDPEPELKAYLNMIDVDSFDD